MTECKNLRRTNERMLVVIMAMLGVMISMLGWFLIEMHSELRRHEMRLSHIESNQRAIAAGLEISLGGDPMASPK